MIFWGDLSKRTLSAFIFNQKKSRLDLIVQATVLIFSVDSNKSP